MFTFWDPEAAEVASVTGRLHEYVGFLIWLVAGTLHVGRVAKSF
jgi:hypothetical protein